MRAVLSAFFYSLACGFVFALAWPAFAQSPLPDAPGKEVALEICGQCHSADILAAVRLTREGWRETIANMVQLGAKASDAEQATILDYVSTHLKGEASRPLNVNSATSLERFAGCRVHGREPAQLDARLPNAATRANTIPTGTWYLESGTWN